MSDCVMRHGGRTHVRTLFVSDLHLGARGSRAGRFLEFLRRIEADEIFLVGDILDVWHCGRLHWSETHDAIMDEFRRRRQAGVRVTYLPGNHDAELRGNLGGEYEGMRVVDQLTHVGADGTRWLVLHGDQCDARILRLHLMTRLGTRVEAFMRGVHAGIMRLRMAGHPCETQRTIVDSLLSGWHKLMGLGNRFERRLADRARASGHDGVICGHFHKPALHDSHGVRYANCGDWVDSMTALVELPCGRMQLIETEAPAWTRDGARDGLREAELSDVMVARV